MQEKLQPDSNHKEKAGPNNSALLERILYLHPKLQNRMRAIVFKNFSHQGNEKSVNVDDIVQKAFLAFIEAANPPREDWPEGSIVSWMAKVINYIIADLHKLDGDLHRRSKNKIRTLQFTKPDSPEAERGILTEDRVKDSKDLPLDNLLARERVPDFVNENLESELDKQLKIDNQIRILRQKYGEENFTRAINTLRFKDHLVGKVASFYYIEHLDYFKIAELLSTNQLKIKKIVREVSAQLLEILSK